MFVTRLRRYYSYTILRDVLLGNIIYSEELYVYVIHTFYVLLCFYVDLPTLHLLMHAWKMMQYAKLGKAI